MPTYVRLCLLLFLNGLFVPLGTAVEVNYWPFFTGERDQEGEIRSWQAGGPIVFSETRPGENISGVRPLFVRFQETERDAGSVHVLYPVFNHRHWPLGSSWDLFNLLRFESSRAGTPEASQRLHLFPVFFRRADPDPERSYLGVFPIAGSTQNTLGYDEIRWFLFPLTARLQQGDVTTLAAPWPFLRLVRGPETSGFHVWPLYGEVLREDVSTHRYWFWPLGYHVYQETGGDVPYEAFGFLPLYASSSSATSMSRTFIWPFFGYTVSSDPEYREHRYLWPFFVQRRGESYRNRWAPFYTRSIRANQDNRWILWPLHRQASWQERDLLNERTQFLYFLYWSNRQSSPAHPELDPAIKQHVWPFYSYWDDGAGRSQFQVFSPFEVFFPFNEAVRAKYSPLFAVYRLDYEEDVRARHSLLFNFITTRREFEEDTFHLNIGPLFRYETGPDRREWEFAKGLLSFSAEEEERSFGALWLNRPRKNDLDDTPRLARPRQSLIRHRNRKPRRAELKPSVVTRTRSS